MTDEPEGGAGRGGSGGVGCLLTSALVLWPTVAVAFVELRGFPALDAAFLSSLLTLLPILTVAQVPLLDAADVDRASAYAGSAVTVLVLGGAAFLLGLRRGGPGALGLGAIAAVHFLVWVAVLLAAAGALTGLFYLVERELDWPETPVLRALLPSTGQEKRLFAALSVAAGFGEEIAYRGYAIPVLAPLLGGAWGAAVFTAVTFGVLHAYQGPVGIVRTALLGLLFAASLLLSGSLWPAIVAHVAVDLAGGLWFGERLVRR